MVVKAIYRDGVFKPIEPVNLIEGERVELEIVRPSQQQERRIISLRGVWKGHLRPTDQDDWVFDTIAEIRSESSEKLAPPR